MEARVKGRPITIGLQVLDLQLDYSVGIAQGMAAFARENDVNLAVFPMEQPKADYGASDNPSVIEELLRSQPVDALVIVTGSLINFLSFNQFYKQIKKLSNIPIVSVGAELENIISVVVDNHTGVYKAVSHLIEVHKLTNIGFVRGPLMHPEAEERYEAYLSCMDDHGLAVDLNKVYDGNFTFEAGVSAAKAMCSNASNWPEAIVCANDDMAFGVIHQLKKMDIQVPQDIAVVGYDNVSEAEYSVPSLSTIDQPVFDIGKRAANLALKAIRGDKTDLVNKIPTSFYPRRSCGCGSRLCLIDPEQDRLSESTKVKTTNRDELMANLARLFCQKLFDHEELADFSRLFDDKSFSLAQVDMLVELIRENLSKNDVDESIRKIINDNIQQVHVCARKTLAEPLAQSLYYALLNVSSNSYMSQVTQDHIDLNNRFLHLRNLLSYAAKSGSTSDFFLSFKKVLAAIDVPYFHIVLYGSERELVGYRYSTGIQDCKTVFSFQRNEDIFSVQEVHHSAAYLYNPELYKDVKGVAFIVEPLIYLGAQFGHICYEWNEHDRYSRLLFSTLLSAKLRSDSLWQDFVKVEQQLDEFKGGVNDSNDSKKQFTDKLTGLLNHKGFYTRSIRQLKNSKVAHEVLPLVYLRVDNYHEILTDFGEEHINICVSFLSEELLSIFSATCLVSRIAPDMFVILCPQYTVDEINDVLANLSGNINEYNAEADQELELNVEMAVNQIHPDSQRSLVDYLGDAEYLLIRAKKN